MLNRASVERGNERFVTFFVPFFQVLQPSPIRVKVKACRMVGIAAQAVL
ncbi:hypothetical protein [Rhizobium sp. CECT 9324]|jgi:hypothetical protein|nr:hypothetical protein [Rhizobium sp. CECT 9324]CAH0341792.1 hypothetical protein RHI9324_03497 [Rhizobium sp. CECT 9324]